MNEENEVMNAGARGGAIDADGDGGGGGGTLLRRGGLVQYWDNL